jgi:transposase
LSSPTASWSRSSVASGSKDFLHLRPVRHWTERRVRGHVAVCVYATVVESLIAAALRDADVQDPEIDDQHLSCERALRELGRVRAVTFEAAGKTLRVVTRRSPLQSRILAALGVATGDWDRARIR